MTSDCKGRFCCATLQTDAVNYISPCFLTTRWIFANVSLWAWSRPICRMADDSYRDGSRWEFALDPPKRWVFLCRFGREDR